MLMKQYSFRVKAVAGLLIVLESLVLIGALGYFVYVKSQSYGLGAGVSRINKENVVFRPGERLKFFYEWEAHQTIVYERSWLPQVFETKTNSDGLISPVDYEPAKPPDVYRILAIGDSFVEGPFVEPGEAYPRQLEALLNASDACKAVRTYEVLNLGVGGYDIEYAGARLLSKGIKYNPDVIIWFLKNDDFIERSDINFIREQKYIEFVNNTLGGDIEKFAPYKKWLNQIGDTKNVSQIIHGVVVGEQVEEEAHKLYFKEQNDMINEVASVIKLPIILATFSDTDAIFKARMRLWANYHENMHFFDKIPALKSGDETFDPHDGHPNSSGYRVIANSLFDELVNNGFVCRD